MTWLPMLFVGRGNQKELKPKPHPAQDIQPRLKKVCARESPTHAGRRNEASRASTDRGPSDARGLLTASEAATKQESELESLR